MPTPQTLLSKILNPHPTRDWFFTLALSCGVFALLLLIAGYLFWGLDSGMFSKALSTKEPVIETVRESEIESTLNFYRARRVEAGVTQSTHIASTTVLGQ